MQLAFGVSPKRQVISFGVLSISLPQTASRKREMLAVLFGSEKFHYYAYGRPVVVESDHKPLEAIFKKHLSSAPPRIARMMLRIQKYDAQMKYVPGKDISVADALSRISLCCGKPYKDLIYLYTRSIFILMLAQRECPRYKKKPPKIQPYRPCAKSLCLDGLKRDLVVLPIFMLTGTTVMSSL